MVAYSCIEEVISKFAQLTPQERTKRYGKRYMIKSMDCFQQFYVVCVMKLNYKSLVFFYITENWRALR